MASFILAVDKVQSQFSNLYWADQQHGTSEGPCRRGRCLPACWRILLKFSVCVFFHPVVPVSQTWWPWIRHLIYCPCSGQETCLSDQEINCLCSFFFFFLCYILSACLLQSGVFPVEDTGGSGRQTMGEREAFDARNILQVGGNLLLSVHSNTAELQCYVTITQEEF